MKKEIIICFVVIAAIVTLSIITETHTDNIMGKTESNLGTLRKDLFGQNQNNKNEISDILNYWEEEKQLLSIYIEHDELEKIETCLREINSNIETEEYNVAVQSLDTCVFLISHIRDKYKLSLKNIF